MKDKIIRIKPETHKKLEKLRDFILKYGTDYIIRNTNYELKNVSFNSLIELLLDIAEINFSIFEIT